MIAEIILTMALQMFPVQLPMTEKAYNDLHSIDLTEYESIEQAAAEWYYANAVENKWEDN